MGWIMREYRNVKKIGNISREIKETRIEILIVFFNLMKLRRTHVENNVREGYKDMISLFKSLEYYM